MPGKAKMNASARKFVARTRLTHSGLFEQKPLRKISSSSTVSIQDIHSTQDITSQAVNLYFSTPYGGKNVLTTNQSSSSAQTILTSCNTSPITQGTIIRTVLTLCDSSVIKALNGSLNLDVTTDPSLKCINDKFTAQCGSDSSSTSTILETLFSLLFLAGCCYAIKKCCCEKKSSESGVNLSENPNSLLAEQNRLLREQHEYYSRLNSQRWQEYGARFCAIL